MRSRPDPTGWLEPDPYYEPQGPGIDLVGPRIDQFLDEVGTALIDDFLEDAAHGRAHDSGGRAYTPEAVRYLGESLSDVDPKIGLLSLRGVDGRHVDALLDDLRRQGTSPVRLDAIVIALRALRAYADEHQPSAGSPLAGPAVREPAATGSEPPRYTRRPYAERPHPRRDYGEQAYAQAPYTEPEPEAKPSPTVELLATARRVAHWTVRSVVFIFAVLVVFLLLEL